MELEQLSRIQIRDIRKPWNRNSSPGYRSERSGNPGTGTVIQDTDQRDQGTLEQEKLSRIQIREPWNRNSYQGYRSEISGNPGTGTVLQDTDKIYQGSLEQE